MHRLILLAILGVATAVVVARTLVVEVRCGRRGMSAGLWIPWEWR